MDARQQSEVSWVKIASNICKCIALFAKDPHLLLYAFLPVLLFGDAMSIVAGHDFGDYFRAQVSRSLTFFISSMPFS